MNTPLVLGLAQRRGPVDHDLALPEREVPSIQQSACEELPEQSRVARERREESQGWFSLHHPVERFGDVWVVRGHCGGRARRHVVSCSPDYLRSGIERL